MAADATTDAIIDLAHLYGWRVAHFRPMAGADGHHRTPVGADGKGFPDLVMVHPRWGILFVECKGKLSTLEPKQREWRDAIFAAIEAVLGEREGRLRWVLWRPLHIQDGTVERMLRGW